MIIARDQLPADTPPPRLPGFAVRGIGKHGLDVHCQTVAAASAPHALMHVFQFHPAATQDAVAWVVTKLPGGT